jgi:hypothetical protein
MRQRYGTARTLPEPLDEGSSEHRIKFFKEWARLSGEERSWDDEREREARERERVALRHPRWRDAASG